MSNSTKNPFLNERNINEAQTQRARDETYRRLDAANPNARALAETETVHEQRRANLAAAEAAQENLAATRLPSLQLPKSSQYEEYNDTPRQLRPQVLKGSDSPSYSPRYNPMLGNSSPQVQRTLQIMKDEAIVKLMEEQGRKRVLREAAERAAQEAADAILAARLASERAAQEEADAILAARLASTESPRRPQPNTENDAEIARIMQQQEPPPLPPRPQNAEVEREVEEILQDVEVVGQDQRGVIARIFDRFSNDTNVQQTLGIVATLLIAGVTFYSISSMQQPDMSNRMMSEQELTNVIGQMKPFFGLGGRKSRKSRKSRKTRRNRK
jgi:hypothetical protein